mmetsp:Transcript_22429/g.38330  ORF Transcript_22429/g.38330 Transcript_22429/m.38330 type:complete len:205 (+) Transcript_22429:476-1090(+)
MRCGFGRRRGSATFPDASTLALLTLLLHSCCGSTVPRGMCGCSFPHAACPDTADTSTANTAPCCLTTVMVPVLRSTLVLSRPVNMVMVVLLMAGSVGAAARATTKTDGATTTSLSATTVVDALIKTGAGRLIMRHKLSTTLSCHTKSCKKSACLCVGWCMTRACGASCCSIRSVSSTGTSLSSADSTTRVRAGRSSGQRFKEDQ